MSIAAVELKEGTILSDKWCVGKVLGSGACGIVYDVKPCNSNKKTYDYSLVVKVISLGRGLSKAKAKEQEKLSNTLFYEYQLYVGHMYPFPYRPQLPEKFYDTDEKLGVRFLVMEKLEMDLMKYSKSKPSVSNIAKIGLQILDGLSWLHQKGFVFVDIKPDNFMLKGDKLYFVDYGLAEMASKNRNQNRALVGTPSYCSLSVHNNNVNVYKDDIESMALVLIALALECKLPWSDAKSVNEVKTTMERCDILQLAESCGFIEMGEVVLMCRELKQNQSLDYDIVRNKLIAMRDRKVTNTKLSEKKNISKKNNSKGKDNNDDNDIDNIVPEKKTNKKINSKVSKTKDNNKNHDDDDDDDDDILEEKKVKKNNSKVSKAKAKDNNNDGNEDNVAPLKKQKTVKSSSDNDKDIILTSPQGKRSSGRFSTSTEKVVKKSLSFKVIAGPAKGTIFKQDSNIDDNFHQFKNRDIGRTEEFSKDEEMSENHIVLLWNWDSSGELDLNVQDKGSTNGTKINNARIAKKTWFRLHDEDIITVGKTEILVVCK